MLLVHVVTIQYSANLQISQNLEYLCHYELETDVASSSWTKEILRLMLSLLIGRFAVFTVSRGGSRASRPAAGSPRQAEFLNSVGDDMIVLSRD